MDEFHYIFENPDRARTYIDALHKSKAKNILLCSATLGDVNKITEYVNRVSERDFFTYENNSRSTSLFFEGDIDSKEIRNSLVVAFSRRNIEEILNKLASSRILQDEEKLKAIKELAKENKITNLNIISYAQKSLAGYYGALLPKEKLFIEKCLEKGLIDTVVGTDALSLGVNFPVENVVFAQLAKYKDGPISKNMFVQLSGRAGRKGYFDEGHVYYCSEFAKLCEAYKNSVEQYNTKELYEKLLEQPNEDVSIRLTANIKKLLLEQTTIDEEVEFISRFSTKKINPNEERKSISNLISFIKYEGFEKVVDELVDERFAADDDSYYYETRDDDDSYYYETRDDDRKEEYSEEKEAYRKDLLAYRVEFMQNIGQVYFEGYSPETNCEIFAKILCGVEPEQILEEYGTSGSFFDMLQFRKYVKLLPKKYRKGLTRIDDIIRDIDETAIDRYRGSVSIEEIDEELEKEGKLDGESVMKVLREQKDMQKMYERADIIDEQLRIAEEYGLEDY